jgi:hypothetical protein
MLRLFPISCSVSHEIGFFFPAGWVDQQVPASSACELQENKKKKVVSKN